MRKRIDFIFDTETTDKADFKADFKASHQPDLAEFGFQVYVDRELKFEYSSYVNSGIKLMEPGAAKVNGITDEMRSTGIKPAALAELVAPHLELATTVVCHNWDFDSRIMKTFAHRHGLGPELAALFNPDIRYCTMRKSTQICKIPGPYGYKWPKLIEAYKHFVDPAGFEGAHSALADVTACAKVYFAMQDQLTAN